MCEPLAPQLLRRNFMIKTTFINARLGEATMELQDLLNDGFSIVSSSFFREGGRVYFSAILIKEVN